MMNSSSRNTGPILNAEGTVLPGISDLLLSITAESGIEIKAPAPRRTVPGGLGSYTLPTIHQQPPSPPYTEPPSICSTPVRAEAALEDLLNQQDPDPMVLIQLISRLLDDSVAPAYRQGWYRPDSPSNKFSQRLEGKLVGFTKNDLVREFFRRNEARQAYGEQVTIPRRPNQEVEDLEMSRMNPEGMAKSCKRQEGREDHKQLERSRRDRHRDLQLKSALRCCEIATECGERHADEEKFLQSTKRTRTKGPGKDEQLFTAIYSHEFSARVVQSEHDGRTRAEKLVRLLLQYLVREHRSNRGARRDGSNQDLMESSSSERRTCVGKKRPRSNSEQEGGHAWACGKDDGQWLLHPPSANSRRELHR
ncbi:hypothetical protein A1O3_10036 [Capronia epimyces CBS 606.96]|uniref:Uncharacterized protein n=1 Tax=Capronia epimyces CBS 606.96 TaxID=1182542 RepID=W9XBE7_9EURO|nr:uncharacterized protein A1O3_10036 [Capronia epimyces CBS 606.96]EXJ77807.1 hypothetical protein A1O3_10036 [Capronia epimyces CBS 606.96]